MTQSGLLPPREWLDERWTEIMGRRVWRNTTTGETWLEEKDETR